MLRALDEEYVRSQDFFSLISSVTSHSNGLITAWDWVRDNYQILIDKFGVTNRYFQRMVPGLAQKFKTEQKLQEVFCKKFSKLFCFFEYQ